MSYQIHITRKAERDIIEAVDYIEFTLLNPQASDHLIDEVDKEIHKLADMPRKFKIVDDSILASWGIRMIVISSYLAFYIIDENSKTVHIIRFLYQKRNWISLLHKESISRQLLGYK